MPSLFLWSVFFLITTLDAELNLLRSFSLHFRSARIGEVINFFQSCALKKAQNFYDIHLYKGYKLVWNDEFEKDGKPDSTNWDYEKGFVRNEEAQW